MIVVELDVEAIMTGSTTTDAPWDHSNGIPTARRLHSEPSARVSFAGVAYDILIVAGAEHIRGYL